MSYYRKQLEKWLSNQVVIADRVLDIGGSANPVTRRVAKWEVKDYKILDNGSEKDYHDKWSKPNFFLDLNEAWGSKEHPGKYDMIFCLEVFEYIFDPVRAINNISSCLKRDGVAYLSFPAIYPVHNPVEADCLRYTRRGVERLLKAGGFTRWDVTPRRATQGQEALKSFYYQEGMRAVKGNSVIYDIGYMVRAKKRRY